jgi:hypothetical protein
MALWVKILDRYNRLKVLTIVGVSQSANKQIQLITSFGPMHTSKEYEDDRAMLGDFERIVNAISNGETLIDLTHLFQED